MLLKGIVCKMSIANDREKYKPGDVISGTLDFFTPVSVKVRKIVARIVCIEELTARFTFGDVINEIYYVDLDLYSSTPGKEMVTEPRKHYNYPFKLKLPSYSIPSSYEHKTLGGINYFVQGQFFVNEFQYPHEVNFLINVDAPGDLNDVPGSCLTPTTISAEKNIGPCACLGSMNAFIDVVLPKLAFLVGDTIDFEINIRNKSRARIPMILIKLQELMWFGKQCLRDDLDTVREKGIQPRSQRSIKCKLVIPEDLYIPSFVGAKMVRCEHIINIDSCMDESCGDPFKKVIDIHIGHIQWEKNKPHPKYNTRELRTYHTPS